MKHKKKGLKQLLSLALIPALPLLCLGFPLLQAHYPGDPYTPQTTLVLYAEPDRSAKILCTLTPGVTTTILETLEDGWQRTQAPDGTSGYIQPQKDVNAPPPPPSPIQGDPIPYTLDCAAALFRQPHAGSDILQHLNNGDPVTLTGAVKNGMVMAKTPAGLVGFLDSATLRPNVTADFVAIMGGNQSPQGVQNLFNSTHMLLPFADRLALLSTFFPQAGYWNTLGLDTAGLSQEWAVSITTQKPCNHKENGFQYCQTYTGKVKRLLAKETALQGQGFASMVSDFLFGKNAPTRSHTDLTALQPGDILQLDTTGQAMVVTACTPTTVTVLLCNNDGETCKISWDKTFAMQDLTPKKLRIISRLEA